MNEDNLCFICKQLKVDIVIQRLFISAIEENSEEYYKASENLSNLLIRKRQHDEKFCYDITQKIYYKGALNDETKS